MLTRETLLVVSVTCRSCGVVLTTANSGEPTADGEGCQLVEARCWDCAAVGAVEWGE